MGAAAVWWTGCVAPTDRATTQEWRSVAIGLCEDYPEETRSLAQARVDLQRARAAGASVLRIAFGWDAMEPSPRVYDWSFWDEFVPMATREFGLRLIPYVCYTPPWAARDSGPDHWRSPPRDPEDFGRFMAMISARYGAMIDDWELWNEPDNAAYWTGDVTEFAALVRAGAEGVRRGDPGARVVLGGIATETVFLERLFRDERIAPSVDVVNTHSYFETWHPDSIERLPQYVGEIAEIVREHGEDETLWMAETGYSSVGARREVSQVYRARFVGEHSEEAQANALLRTLLLALATDDLSLVAWYRINDLPSSEDVIGDDNNRHLGLRRVSQTAKPVERAFARVASLFAQPFRSVEVEVSLEDGAREDVQVIVFELSDGRYVVAAWLAMPGSANVADSLEADSREVALRVRVPGSDGRRGRDGELRLTLRGSLVEMCVIE